MLPFGSRESEWEKLQVCRPLSGCNTMESMGLKCWTSPKACWCRRSGDQEDSTMCHELGDLNGWLGKFIFFRLMIGYFLNYGCVCVCVEEVCCISSYHGIKTQTNDVIIALWVFNLSSVESVCIVRSRDIY